MASLGLAPVRRCTSTTFRKRLGASFAPDNVEFFLGTLFASTKANGGVRPGLFDAAFLATRYRTEFALLELPAVVRHVVIPTVYMVGTIVGKYRKFKDAPAPIAPNRVKSRS
jgi:hypothetical protein